jgi:hypothetical protein
LVQLRLKQTLPEHNVPYQLLSALTVGVVARYKRIQTSKLVIRSPRELVEELRKQFELLKSACERYDQGSELEVIHIAARLRVILAGPQSVIGRLHLSRDLKFRDTSTHRLAPDHNVLIANIGVEITQGVDAKWIPLFERWPEGQPKPPPQRFSTWWTEPIMPMSMPDGLDRTPRYSRQRLVLAIANQDGGARVGDRDKDYDELTRDHFSFEVAFRGPDGDTAFQPVQGNPVNVCVRQIAHEVLGTLSLDLPAILQARRL